MDHINCSLSTSEEDQYIPLSVSKDSDEEFSNTVKNVTKKYQEGAKFGMNKLGRALNNTIGTDPESLVTHTARELSSDAKNLTEAIIGKCDEYYYNETSFIGLPTSSDLSGRLKAADVRSKLEVDIGSRTFRFFLVFMIKAELNLLYAGAEIVLTLFVVIASLQAMFFGLTFFVGLVGSIAFLASLNLIHLWYGFSRYNTFGENLSIGIFSGQAIDHRFEQIRDVCSFHANGDYRRRNQSISIFLTLPFTICYHATTGVFFIGSWIAKKLANKQMPYAPPFWGILLTNCACTGLWLFGGNVWMGIAVLYLIIQQRLYSSLLCRRGFPDFLLSAIVGNIFTIESEAAMSTLLDHIDDNCIGHDNNSMCEPVWGRGTKDQAPYDPPSVGSFSNESVVEDIESGSASVSDHVRNLGQTCNPDDYESTAESENGALLPDLPNDMMTDMSDEFDDKLELLKEVPVSAEARSVSSTRRKSQDVYFGLDSHEGTREWKETVLRALQEFDIESYTDEVHTWVMGQLEDRLFFTLNDDTGNWDTAGEDAVRQLCRNYFVGETDPEANQRDLGENDSYAETEEEEANVKSSKSRHKWRLTPKKQKRSKKKRKRLWKSLTHRKTSDTASSNAEKAAERGEHTEDPSRRFSEVPTSELGVVLNRDSTPSFLRFRGVLQEAAEKHYPAEYSDAVHQWVLEYIGPQTFHVESTTNGFYRNASAIEVSGKAMELYGFYKERLQLVEYLLKEVDIEMTEYREESEDDTQRGDVTKATSLDRLATSRGHASESECNDAANDNTTQGVKACVADEKFEGDKRQTLPDEKSKENERSASPDEHRLDDERLLGGSDTSIDEEKSRALNEESSHDEESLTQNDKSTKDEPHPEDVDNSVDNESTREFKIEIVPRSLESKIGKGEDLYAHIMTILTNEFMKEGDDPTRKETSDVVNFDSESSEGCHDQHEDTPNAEASPIDASPSEHDKVLDCADVTVDPLTTNSEMQTATHDAGEGGHDGQVTPKGRSKRGRSKFVLGLWKRALGRRTDSEIERKEQTQEDAEGVSGNEDEPTKLVDQEFLEETRLSGASIDHEVTSTQGPDQALNSRTFSRDENIISVDVSSVVPEPEGDGIELVSKRQVAKNDSQSEQKKHKTVENIPRKESEENHSTDHEGNLEAPASHVSLDEQELSVTKSDKSSETRAMPNEDNPTLDDKTAGDSGGQVAKQLDPPGEMGETIYDQILSVLTEEFMKDAANSGDGFEGKSADDRDAMSRDQGTNEEASISESGSSGAHVETASSPPIKSQDSQSQPVDTSSLYGYLMCKLRQEQAGCGCQNDTVQSQDMATVHSGEEEGLQKSSEAAGAVVTTSVPDETEENPKFSRGSKEDAASFGEAPTASNESDEEAEGHDNEEEDEAEKNHQSDSENLDREEGGEINASVEVEAREETPLPDTPKVMRTIVHVPRTVEQESSDQEVVTAEEASSEVKKEGQTNYDEPNIMLSINPSVEVEAREVPTSPLPNSPKSLRMFVRDPCAESDEEAEPKRRPRKMIVPRTFSPPSAVAKPSFFSQDEEDDSIQEGRSTARTPRNALSPSSVASSASRKSHHGVPKSPHRPAGSSPAKLEIKVPKRRMMSPKTLIMKDVVTNKHDYMSAESLPPEHRPIKKSAAPIEATEVPKSPLPNSPANQKVPDPATPTQAEALNAPIKKKMMTPKTLSLKMPETNKEGKQTMDDSKKMKKWISESRSKRPRSKFFASLMKRASKGPKGNQQEERQQAYIEPSSKMTTVPDDDDDEAMYIRMLSVLEDDFIRESSSVSTSKQSINMKTIGATSSGRTSKNEGAETTPTVNDGESPSSARNIDVTVLYKYVTYKVQEENAAGCNIINDDDGDGADESRNPNDSESFNRLGLLGI